MDTSNNNNNTGGGEILAPWDPPNLLNPNNLDAAQAAAWRERERRQRTIRLLMMFLLMLLLMDSEEQSNRKRLAPRHRRNQQRAHLSKHVFSARQAQEVRLKELTQKHSRYKALTEKNLGKNVPVEVMRWAEQQSEVVKDEFVLASPKEANQEEPDPEEDNKVFHYPWNATGFYRGEWTRMDDNDALEGGETAAEDPNSSNVNHQASTADVDTFDVGITTQRRNKATTGDTNVIPTQYIDALALEKEMLQLMKERKEGMGVVLLPPGKEIILRYDRNNFSSFDWLKYSSAPPKGADHYFMRAGGTASAKDASGIVKGYGTKDEYNADSSTAEASLANPSLANAKVTLTKGSGRAAFQLFSRSIPSMQEISLVDGFLKLYDSNMPGYSTQKDILLRVRGVLIHAIGRMSLVSNAGPGRSVFVLGDLNTENGSSHDDQASDDEKAHDLGHRRRRLEGALATITESSTLEESLLNQIRDDATALFGSQQGDAGDTQLSKDGFRFKFDTIELQDAEVADGTISNEDDSKEQPEPVTKIIVRERRTQVLEDTNAAAASEDTVHQPYGQRHVVLVPNAGLEENGIEPGKFTWSNVVLPYPFVVDDEDETIRKAKTPAARKMPPREQLLERNAGICEFEVTMDTKEVQWTIGEWRKLMGRRVRETIDLNPANHPAQAENEDSNDDRRSDRKSRIAYGSSSSKSAKSSREHLKPKPIQDQALVMTMNGSIHSPNCFFAASLNVTALRTDWEHTTGKAINYSFYMMLTCLTQIMVLLRQLLHTQPQSAASRVSLLCIGWQTVLDALLCLGHIYLSLAMQPLFTAFASVAFFKLLIFCVIEMKYMALILQARNSSSGGNTTELLRRQVAMLHLRFYCALFGAFLAFFYAGEKYHIPYNLALYSFWVPQIILNVVTEAKRPLHHYYIYGMSITRLVAPLYIYAVPKNFLKEVYPESPTDLYMCELLVLWMAIQTAVLIAQGKYGARFMIPARFLPPKFDYSRPIPPSLLPPGASQDVTPDLSLRQGWNLDTSSSLAELQSVPSNDPVVLNRHATGVTTRNRIKGSRVNRQETTMTTETVVNDTDTNSAGHTLDCVICYNAIDVHNRRGYMLAPCDHIFHKDCLVQWMDVKMECPICRTELPSL